MKKNHESILRLWLIYFIFACMKLTFGTNCVIQTISRVMPWNAMDLVAENWCGVFPVKSILGFDHKRNMSFSDSTSNHVSIQQVSALKKIGKIY